MYIRELRPNVSHNSERRQNRDDGEEHGDRADSNASRGDAMVVGARNSKTPRPAWAGGVQEAPSGPSHIRLFPTRIRLCPVPARPFPPTLMGSPFLWPKTLREESRVSHLETNPVYSDRTLRGTISGLIVHCVTTLLSSALAHLLSWLGAEESARGVIILKCPPTHTFTNEPGRECIILSNFIRRI